MLTPQALREIHRLSNEARSLARGNQRDRKNADVILAKIAAINHAGISTDEANLTVLNEVRKEMGMPEVNFEEVRKQKRHEELFRRFIAGGAIHEMAAELRDLAAGSQSISWSDGSEGGFLVPQSVAEEFTLGLAATTPLLDQNVVTIRTTPDRAAAGPGSGSNPAANDNPLRPITIPAVNTTFAGGLTAYRLGENVSSGENTAQPVVGTALGQFAYRTLDLPISFEFEQDSFNDVMEIINTALPIALARGAGADLAYGSGDSEPTGILTAAQSSGVVISISESGPGGVASSPLLTALEEVQQAVDVVHRNHSKCAWMMDDGSWFAIRKYAPPAARPLDFDKGDCEYAYSVNCGGYLLGKPVIINNDFAGSNGSNPLANIIFGNLSRFYVRRAGGIRIKRNLESAYVTKGQALYTALMRLDSNIIAAGDTPIVSATIGS